MAKLIKKEYVDSGGGKHISTWQAEFRDPQRHPARKRVSLRTKDKADATRKLVMLERDYALGIFDPWQDRIQKQGKLLTKAIDEFVEDRRKAGRRPKTIENYRNVLRIFAESVAPDMLVDHLEPRHVERFLARQDINETSRANYLRHIRAFFRWCVEESLMQQVPLPEERGKRRKAKKRVVEFLTREQYDLLIQHIEAKADARPTGNSMWLANVIKVAVHTGLRLGELCRLRWADVNLRTGFLTVRESKSGHERSVFLAGPAREVVERLHAAHTTKADENVFKTAKGNPLDDKRTSRRFRETRDETGLPTSLHFHSLRHTFASWAVMGGMDLFKLKEILGHADIRMTLVYAHLRPDAQKDDMLRIFGNMDGKTSDSDRIVELQKEKAALQKENDRLCAELERLRGGRVEEPAIKYLALAEAA